MTPEFHIDPAALAALDQALQDFPKKLQTFYLTRALRAGAKVVQAQAQRNVPVRTGTLRRNLVVRTAQRRGAQSRVSIGVRQISQTYASNAENRRKGRVGKKYKVAGPAFYGWYVEKGTKKMRGEPFLEPALKGQESAAVQAFADSLKRDLEQAYVRR